MKLLIDISEKQYEIAKEYVETVDDKSSLAKAIVNSIEYETDTEFADRCRECRREKVLDKIRSEIMNLTDGEIPERIWNVDVLQIIDKYKAEGE